jgi:hypothetical protein
LWSSLLKQKSIDELINNEIIKIRSNEQLTDILALGGIVQMEFLIRRPRLAKIRTYIIDLRVAFKGNYELDALKINATATIITIMNE